MHPGRPEGLHLSRRGVATLVAVAVAVVLGIIALQHPVGYTVFSPGPTVNVLGRSAGQQIIDVSGHKAYRDKGGLRLVTIYETGIAQKVSLASALLAWVDPTRDVYPHDAVYQKQDTTSSVKQQSAQEMVSSQDSAVAAALRALHIKYTSAVGVSTVDEKGPSRGLVKKGDLILSVDGVRTATTTALVDRIRSLAPGSEARLVVRRDGQDKTVTVTTEALGTKGKTTKESRVGVLIAPSYDFPFDVKLHLSDNIGGPSAGLMFSLGVYDVLTPGSLTDGKVIAGTGEIDSQGRVGEIGGIRQKMVGAQHDGARLFLVPAGNCAEALGGHYDSKRMRLVRVTTMESALAAIKAWTADPNAELPRCTR